MDNALSALLSVSFIFFTLMIAGFTWLIRHVIDYFLVKRNISKKNIWTELLLPIVPMFLGVFIALIAKMYPFPMGISSVSGRVAFGIVSGLLSGFVYRWIKSAIVMKTHSVKNDSEPPKESSSTSSFK